MMIIAKQTAEIFTCISLHVKWTHVSFGYATKAFPTLSCTICVIVVKTLSITFLWDPLGTSGDKDSIISSNHLVRSFDLAQNIFLHQEQAVSAVANDLPHFGGLVNKALVANWTASVPCDLHLAQCGQGSLTPPAPQVSAHVNTICQRWYFETPTMLPGHPSFQNGLLVRLVDTIWIDLIGILIGISMKMFIHWEPRFWSPSLCHWADHHSVGASLSSAFLMRSFVHALKVFK